MANARQCVGVHSSWIAWVILMCDNTLSVGFKNGFACNYLRSTAGHFRQMLAAPSKGKWLHRNLYRILPYRAIRLPCPAAGCGVNTTCCGNLPLSLHATINLGIGSQAINWDGTTYWSIHQLPAANCGGQGPQLSLRLSCPAGPGDTACTGMVLEYTCDGVTWIQMAQTACSCSPLSLSYSVLMDPATCGICATQTLTVTVTT